MFFKLLVSNLTKSNRLLKWEFKFFFCFHKKICIWEKSHLNLLMWKRLFFLILDTDKNVCCIKFRSDIIFLLIIQSIICKSNLFLVWLSDWVNDLYSPKCWWHIQLTLPWETRGIIWGGKNITWYEQSWKNPLTSSETHEIMKCHD